MSIVVKISSGTVQDNLIAIRQAISRLGLLYESKYLKRFSQEYLILLVKLRKTETYTQDARDDKKRTESWPGETTYLDV